MHQSGDGFPQNGAFGFTQISDALIEVRISAEMPPCVEQCFAPAMVGPWQWFRRVGRADGWQKQIPFGNDKQ